MAGSLNHIVDHETGEYREELIENLGDAYEALEECYHIIRKLTKGDIEKVNAVCRELNFPEIQHNMTTRKIRGYER